MICLAKASARRGLKRHLKQPLFIAPQHKSTVYLAVTMLVLRVQYRLLPLARGGGETSPTLRAEAIRVARDLHVFT